ncbi:MAG: hypothetical protein N2260_00190 [Syntrophobacterales bacterium]|nr:hypothetical protein [Syntrophobacterales bacterium]
MEEKNRPLAVGHLKETSLLKRLPDSIATKILKEYVKKKTGRSPEAMNTISGVIIYCEEGKIFFQNGEIDFEPSPFHIKKVKSWLEEIRSILIFYASKIYVAEVKKVLYEKFHVAREQELEGGGFIFEINLSGGATIRLIVTPKGRIAAFSIRERNEGLEKQALEIIKTLETRGLVDF